MSRYDYDMAVIGGGAAGLTAASGAAQLGAKTLIIEKEPKLGGDCLHYGCVPSKTLIKTARIYHQIGRSRRYGLPEIDRPPIDFRAVAERISTVIASIQRHDSVARFCELGAEVRFGDPRFTDEHSCELDGKTVTAKTWLIATGSRAAAPPVPGLDTTNYLTNREIFSLERLPESLVVLGGGPIAIEMAQSFCRLGSRVTVIQRSNQILSKEDRDLADQIMEVMKEEGVVFHLGCRIIQAFEEDGLKKIKIKTSEDQITVVHGQELLVALGRAVNTEGLGLKTVGIAHDRKGLKVDTRLRTSHKHIYGAGDVIGGPQFTHAAGYEGGVVVSNAIFHLPRKVDYTFMPRCTYSNPELAGIGMNEKTARAAGLEYRSWTEEFAANDRSLTEGETSGMIKLLIGERGKPLGVQILGHRAGDLLAEWIAVLNGGLKLSGLAGAIHPYPTLAEINKRVVGNVFSEKIFSDTVKKGLRFLFNFKGRACNLKDLPK